LSERKLSTAADAPQNQALPSEAHLRKMMAKEGFKFSTVYGQLATMYWLSNPRIANVAEACLNPTAKQYRLARDGGHSIAIEVSLHNDAVYLVYHWLSIRNLCAHLFAMAKTGDLNPFYRLIVHNGIARPLYEYEAQILQTSIWRNLPPAICAVLTKPDDK
jgi:hypothetical protein